MDGFATVGQRAAVTAVQAMLAAHVPHALLLVGPASVGKHVLAMDLAAALLCTGASGPDRPCRRCRACRMVEHGNHPDLHRLAPSGPGLQIRIGEDQHPEPGTIRRLAIDLALLPVEGGQRVAIIRDAQRMNEVAQSALLKTLEEPPSATTLVLCADDEELLLPTIRSRCARIRLGTLGTRDVEQLLADRGMADPPAAARFARLAGGRPGVAAAYAVAPDAVTIRAELVRTLIDLLAGSSAVRLVAARDLLARAMTLAKALEPVAAVPDTIKGGRRRVAADGAAADGVAADAPDQGSAGSADSSGTSGTAKVSAAERRRALGLLIELWREVARDLACAQGGAAGSIRDVDLLDELEAAARRLPPGAASQALARLVRASELLDVNVTPELVLDVLLIRWPRAVEAA